MHSPRARWTPIPGLGGQILQAKMTPALTLGVSTNFVLANFLASRSFGNVSVTLACFRFAPGSSNETYLKPWSVFVIGDMFPDSAQRGRCARS